MKHTYNNFDFLRFAAATLVVFSHCYPLSGRSYEPIAAFTLIDTGGGVAVSIFFVISGYLITGSYLSAPAFRPYFSKRILRIFPAFLCSILFCALVIGPLFTTLTLPAYFIHEEFWHFLRNARLFILHLELPGVFRGNYNKGVDGVWWTLPMEFFMYIMVFVAGKGGVLTRQWLWVVVCTLLVIHSFLLPESGKFLHMPLFHLTKNGALFLSGSLLYLYRVQVMKHSFALLAAVSAITASAIMFNHLHGAVIIPGATQNVGYMVWLACLPYLVVVIGLKSWPVIRSWGRYGDFSYGIYLYAFPLQQSMTALGLAQHSIPLYFALTMLGTLPLAVLSWRYIEAPSLRYKASFTS